MHYQLKRPTALNCLVLVSAWLIMISTVMGQSLLTLDTNCVVSVLNRTARVRADGTWRIDNVPANMGLVRVRATCVKGGVTLSGQSDWINLEANIDNGFSPFSLGNATQVPSALAITTSATTLKGVGATAQLTVTATYPDNSTKNVTAAAEGTSYTSVISTPPALVPTVWSPHWPAARWSFRPSTMEPSRCPRSAWC